MRSEGVTGVEDRYCFTGDLAACREDVWDEIVTGLFGRVWRMNEDEMVDLIADLAWEVEEGSAFVVTQIH